MNFGGFLYYYIVIYIYVSSFGDTHTHEYCFVEKASNRSTTQPGRCVYMWCVSHRLPMKLCFLIMNHLWLFKTKFSRSIIVISKWLCITISLLVWLLLDHVGSSHSTTGSPADGFRVASGDCLLWSWGAGSFWFRAKDGGKCSTCRAGIFYFQGVLSIYGISRMVIFIEMEVVWFVWTGWYSAILWGCHFPPDPVRTPVNTLMFFFFLLLLQTANYVDTHTCWYIYNHIISYVYIYTCNYIYIILYIITYIYT